MHMRSYLHIYIYNYLHTYMARGPRQLKAAGVPVASEAGVRPPRGVPGRRAQRARGGKSVLQCVEPSFRDVEGVMARVTCCCSRRASSPTGRVADGPRHAAGPLQDGSTGSVGSGAARTPPTSSHQKVAAALRQCCTARAPLPPPPHANHVHT